MTQQNNDITLNQTNSTFFYVGSVGGSLQQSDWITWAKPKNAKFVYILACNGGDGGYGGDIPTSNRAGIGGLNGIFKSIFIPALMLPDNLYIKLGYGASGGIGQTGSTNASERVGGYGGVTRVAIYPTNSNTDNILYCFPTNAGTEAAGGNLSKVNFPDYYGVFLNDIYIYGKSSGLDTQCKNYDTFSHLGILNDSPINLFSPNAAPGVARTTNDIYYPGIDYNNTSLYSMNVLTTAGAHGGISTLTTGGSVRPFSGYYDDNTFVKTVSGGAENTGGNGENGIGHGTPFTVNALNDSSILFTNGVFPIHFTGGAGGGYGNGVKGGNGGHGGPGCGGGGGGYGTSDRGGNGGDGGPGFVFIQCL